MGLGFRAWGVGLTSCKGCRYIPRDGAEGAVSIDTEIKRFRVTGLAFRIFGVGLEFWKQGTLNPKPFGI